jgi:hypothetical protein
VAAGCASYVLIQEKNNYHTMMNGAEENVTSSYKNSSHYFAATIDISTGYERILGNNVSIRTEPFIQIPLKGIGMGALPVKSIGIRVGVSLFPGNK